jgi:hypothetical protein
MYLEKSRGCGLRIGVALRRACAPPMLPPIAHLSGECPTPFREPPRFIVIAATSVIHLYLWGFLHDGELRVCSGTVTSLSGLLSQKKRPT